MPFIVVAISATEIGERRRETLVGPLHCHIIIDGECLGGNGRIQRRRAVAY